ncbi:hypothetical protein FOA52_003281 [Chlamydomonas sp. UWO 241]|nr:hypothetical protein FOA52_003281 [Chlamydomonas sp. UWO 241]
MPPCPSQRDLRKLVRKLDEDARPGEQRQALATITELSRDPDSMAAMAAAGAIPGLAQLMATSSRDGVGALASGALMGVFKCPSRIPHLVQLLGPENPVCIREIAAGYLSDISRDPEHAATLIAVGGILKMAQLLALGCSAQMQFFAATALRWLIHAAKAAVAISAAGAIPPLVQLLGPRSAPALQEAAAGVLSLLAADRDNVAPIAAAGAIPPLVQLLVPGAPAARSTP